MLIDLCTVASVCIFLFSILCCDWFLKTDLALSSRIICICLVLTFSRMSEPCMWRLKKSRLFPVISTLLVQKLEIFLVIWISMSYLDIWICLNEVFWSTLQKRFWSLVCCSLDLVIVHCRTLICLSFHWSAKSSCHWKDAGVFICIIHLSCLLWWSVVCSPSEAHPVSPQNIPLDFFFQSWIFFQFYFLHRRKEAGEGSCSYGHTIFSAVSEVDRSCPKGSGACLYQLFMEWYGLTILA